MDLRGRQVHATLDGSRPRSVGLVDGHVRPYHGRKHRLPKNFVPRRRLCMPATTGVNDARAQPLFFVTAEANDTGSDGQRRRKCGNSSQGPSCAAGGARRHRWASEGVDVLT